MSFFNIGLAEMIILGFIGVVVIVVPAVIIIAVVVANKTKDRDE